MNGESTEWAPPAGADSSVQQSAIPPVEQPAAAPPPRLTRRFDRRLVIIFTATLLGVVILGAVAIFASYRLIPAPATPSQVVGAYFDAYHRGDVRAVREVTCAASKSSVQKYLSDYAAWKKQVHETRFRFDILNTELKGRSATVYITETSEQNSDDPESDQRYEVTDLWTFTLTNESRHWRVCGTKAEFTGVAPS